MTNPPPVQVPEALIYAELPKHAATGLGEEYESFDQNGKPMGKAYQNLVYYTEDQMRAFADATHTLRASHGQAPAGAGEAAEHYRNAIASACEGWTMPDGLRKHLEAALWNPPTPQPTQAQAGVVPLTDEQIEALPLWKRFVGLWPETRREIVRTIERHHGIKGGQHGTE